MKVEVIYQYSPSTCMQTFSFVLITWVWKVLEASEHKGRAQDVFCSYMPIWLENKKLIGAFNL